MTAQFPPPEIGRELVVERASSISVKPVEWLWPGRVAVGKLTLVAGEAGLGKSQIALAMAAAVSTGGRWPCDEGCAPLGNVIILSTEDGAADTVVPRLMAAGANLERVHLVRAVLADDGGERLAFNCNSTLACSKRRSRSLATSRWSLSTRSVHTSDLRLTPT